MFETLPLAPEKLKKHISDDEFRNLPDADKEHYTYTNNVGFAPTVPFEKQTEADGNDDGSQKNMEGESTALNSDAGDNDKSGDGEVSEVEENPFADMPLVDPADNQMSASLAIIDFSKDPKDDQMKLNEEVLPEWVNETPQEPLQNSDALIKETDTDNDEHNVKVVKQRNKKKS